MNENDATIWGEIWRSAAASATLAAAAWGAAGGATNALIIKVRTREAIRQIALGALTSAGMGTGSGAVIVHWLDLPAEVIPVLGAGGAASYFVGVFGPAIIEVVLSRIGSGRLPGEGG